MQSALVAMAYSVHSAHRRIQDFRMGFVKSGGLQGDDRS